MYKGFYLFAELLLVLYALYCKMEATEWAAALYGMVAVVR